MNQYMNLIGQNARKASLKKINTKVKNDFKTNVMKAFEAGCNIVLHCNGNIKEMNTLAKISPKIDNFIVKKTSELYKFLL